EQLADGVLVLDLRDRLTASMQVAALAERDELFDDRTDFLCLRQGRHDLLMGDERGSHVGEHGLAVACGAVELATGFLVAHLWSPLLAGIRLQSNGRMSIPFLGVSIHAQLRAPRPALRAPKGACGLSIGLRSAWRGLRYSPAARRELPYRDGGPWMPELP